MNYDIQITGFKNERAKMIIARQLAHNPAISLNKARIMVDNLPLILLKCISENEISYHLQQLKNIGISFKVLEAAPLINKESPNGIFPAIPKSINQVENSNPSHSTSTTSTNTHPELAPGKNSLHLFSETLQPETTSIFKRLFPLIIALIVITLLITGFRLAGKRKTYSIKQTDAFIQKESSGNDQKSKQNSTKKAPFKSAATLRKEISQSAKTSSLAYTDSAKVSNISTNTCINFYKIAISFNKYNIHAWYGLINTYKSAGMVAEMNNAQEQMYELFGEKIFSITEIINKFGTLSDAYITESNVYRVEFQSHSYDELRMTQDAFTIIKAIRSISNYKAISLFSVIRPGSGLMVHAGNELSLNTLETFKKEASLRFLK